VVRGFKKTGRPEALKHGAGVLIGNVDRHSGRGSAKPVLRQKRGITEDNKFRAQPQLCDSGSYLARAVELGWAISSRQMRAEAAGVSLGSSTYLQTPK